MQHPRPDDAIHFVWNLLNRQREFAILAGIFFMVALVGIPLFLSGATRAALVCAGLCLFFAFGALWARQSQSLSRYQRRLGRLRKSSPESQFVVSITDDHFQVSGPDGLKCQVTWSELQSVSILTNSWGPWVTDFWYVLEGLEATCLVPLGATNLNALSTRLQQLPNWDVEQTIEALGSTSDKHFVCWTANHA